MSFRLQRHYHFCNRPSVVAPSLQERFGLRRDLTHTTKPYVTRRRRFGKQSLMQQGFESDGLLHQYRHGYSVNSCRVETRLRQRLNDCARECRMTALHNSNRAGIDATVSVYHVFHYDLTGERRGPELIRIPRPEITVQRRKL